MVVRRYSWDDVGWLLKHIHGAMWDGSYNVFRE